MRQQLRGQKDPVYVGYRVNGKMIDPVNASLAALTSNSPLGVLFVFVGGIVSSIGPCVAPRYIAIAAIANGPRRTRDMVAFIAGLIAAYVTFGYVAGMLGALWSYSGLIDLLLAAGLFVGGIATIVRAHPRTHACLPRHARLSSVGGGPFLLGAASALVVSPCCTPVVASVVATSTAIGRPLEGAILLAAFGLGHALPLVFAGFVSSRAAGLLAGLKTSQASGIISGSLMIALGSYYGLLA
ncbi:MAG: hypothetical protein NVSMB5_06190 [Candidatus Velthaea sp.]